MNLLWEKNYSFEVERSARQTLLSPLYVLERYFTKSSSVMFSSAAGLAESLFFYWPIIFYNRLLRELSK